ncbi:MAG: hypothetical protein LUE93_08460 [Bacteroides sp.]|nr:hypothetical protein [Bacteroides sp.]
MGCTQDVVNDPDFENGVTLRLSVKRLAARVVDEDNLAEEQTIKNLSIFLRSLPLR